MVFQDNNLFPHLTIAQNVALAVEPRLAVSAATRRHVDDVLARVGLGGFGARKPGALSGGQQSRAALARVLLADRPVVLLDEPFAALGPGLRHEMLELVKDVLNDKLVMMVTHDPNDPQQFGGSTILIDTGRAARAQDTAAIFANPPEVLKAYLGH
jgi:thiamine transport system ATP-binding protein